MMKGLVTTLILFCLMFSVLGCAEQTPDFEIAFLETGDSDCIVIQTPDSVIMIDTAYDSSFEKIKTYLDNQQIAKIDYLILTHFDKDHVGSAASIINSCEVGEVIAPNYEKQSEYMTALSESMQAKKVKYSKISEDVNIELNGVRLWISVPQESYYENENNYSLIVSLKYEGYSFLFMGDALKLRTQEFVNYADFEEWSYCLIKAPHHGDYSKPIKAIYESCPLQYCVITTDMPDNVGNKLIELNKELDVKPFYTFNGDVFVAISNGELKVSQR